MLRKVLLVLLCTISLAKEATNAGAHIAFKNLTDKPVHLKLGTDINSTTYDQTIKAMSYSIRTMSRSFSLPHFNVIVSNINLDGKTFDNVVIPAKLGPHYTILLFEKNLSTEEYTLKVIK